MSDCRRITVRDLYGYPLEEILGYLSLKEVAKTCRPVSHDWNNTNLPWTYLALGYDMPEAALLNLGRMTGLTALNLRGSCATDSVIRALHPLVNLTSLDLGGCHDITSDGFESLRNLSSLDEINLTHTNLTDTDLALLGAMPLRKINVSSNRGVTDAGLARLGTPALRTLDLSHCDRVTDAGLACLNAPGLQYLDLSDCFGVTDDGLACLRVMPLRKINVSFNLGVTDAGIALLGTPRLLCLDLSYCSGVTDAGLARLNAPRLRYLNLSGCSGVTDLGVALLSVLPLRALNLFGCLNVDDRRPNFLNR